jgi:hypothetical protein
LTTVGDPLGERVNTDGAWVVGVLVGGARVVGEDVPFTLGDKVPLMVGDRVTEKGATVSLMVGAPVVGENVPFVVGERVVGEDVPFMLGA